ncbi:uncharacterized protein LOC127639485 [Xyrauchen texanus]|uniref:uncharacterized protein LOC127639485 n=1 Tax=Xyrauchen texanus TaxID=154827 RepID=UPI0022428F21|nr:uncharacterized protein LOC127639485 [Xyrauchen texanus]
MFRFIIFYLIFLYKHRSLGGERHITSVFGVAIDGVKTVSEMEGDFNNKLPSPEIIRDSPSCASLSSSGSKCGVVCSVMNVARGTLSWYNGSNLVSSISVSDLNWRLYMDVEYPYKHNYNCILSNSHTNRTTSLSTDLCLACLDNGTAATPVREGDSVTLHTTLTELLINYIIRWIFGPSHTVIAEIKKNIDVFSKYDCKNERFTDRLMLDDKTGDLTIINMTKNDTGMYYLEVTTLSQCYQLSFNVTVYDRLPIPVITNDSSQCPSSSESSSKCVLGCSVVNVTQIVTLSWYKGNSLQSSKSSSDLNRTVSLCLMVNFRDKSNYSCVINNSFANQTTYLNIDELCPYQSAQNIVGEALGGILGVLVILAGIYMCHKHQKRTNAEGSQVAARASFTSVGAVKNIIETVTVMQGEPVFLQSGVTALQEDNHVIWWFDGQDIAEILDNTVKFNHGDDERFNNRLQLDKQTGSLSIENIRVTNAGRYTLQIIRPENETPLIFVQRIFCVHVYAPLPIPTITSTSSRCTSVLNNSASPKCSLLCSVVNMTQVTLSWYKRNSLFSSTNVSVLSRSFFDEWTCLSLSSFRAVNNPITHQSNRLHITDLCQLCPVVNVTPATLSWYKGNRLLSSISVSDLNSSLSLPLEVEYQDNNIYSCVINNPISSQTKRLNITEVCQPCPVSRRLLYLLALIPVVLAIIGGICFCRIRGKERPEGGCFRRTHSVLKYCNVNRGPVQ